MRLHLQALYPAEDGAHMLGWLRQALAAAGLADSLTDSPDRADDIGSFIPKPLTVTPSLALTPLPIYACRSLL